MMRLSITAGLLLLSGSIAIAGPDRVALPADYKDVFVEFPMVNREMHPDQLGTLFANQEALQGIVTGEFPSGSVMIFDVYKAKLDADGEALTDDDGLRVPDAHALSAVMEKRDGWGADIPEDMRNGDWDYATYKPDGSFVEKDFSTCFECHLPLTEEDFVFSNAWSGVE